MNRHLVEQNKYLDYFLPRVSSCESRLLSRFVDFENLPSSSTRKYKINMFLLPKLSM